MDFVKEYLGWLIGLMAVLGTIFYNSRKVEVDQSALILGKWKELVESHQSDITAIKREFADYKKTATDEAAALRRRLSDVETEFAAYRLESARHIAARDDEIAGLKAAIRQNSQSTAHMIGRVRKTATETDDNVDRIEGENTDAHEAMKEALRHIDHIEHNSRYRGEGDDE